MFDHKDIPFIHVVRAISDLSYGIPIVLHTEDRKILVTSVERLSKQSFTRLKALLPNLNLIITKQRASFILQSINSSSAQINCKDVLYEDIQKMVFSLDSFTKHELAIEETTQLEEKALSLLQIAELIPAAIVAEIDGNFPQDFLINILDAAHIEVYATHADDNLEEISSASLDLKSAKGEIKVFRSQFSKDHYAIIIHPKNQIINATVPLVRVHSSCFTGDILGSIKCDCLDQLQGAIKIMSEGNGGVIIYLNQEGRGVGLTNKIRVYQAQSMGFDTVEANENLGLKGDLRGFAIAAKILKLLHIDEIKLLSNNPNKVTALTQQGIKVQAVYSHQFLSEEVRKYYEAKVRKFKHNIDIF
jgi:GTP cyclohydrolase II